MNHVEHTAHYDRYESAVPDWARKTLAEQAGDPRDPLYDEAALAEGRTHDRHWNAAMREMRETGYMHNHMRMYWGKKILEWSPSPERRSGARWRSTTATSSTGAIRTRSPTSPGVRPARPPWARRKIFGTVRYLSANTLRKFDAEAYLHTVDELCARRKRERGPGAGAAAGLTGRDHGSHQDLARRPVPARPAHRDRPSYNPLFPQARRLGRRHRRPPRPRRPAGEVCRHARPRPPTGSRRSTWCGPAARWPRRSRPSEHGRFGRLRASHVIEHTPDLVAFPRRRPAAAQARRV